MPPADPSATAYFDFNKANLTAEAQQTIANEASLIAQFHYQHVTITGYCDAAEAHRHGCADLGGRRAAVARDELVRLGVTITDVQVVASDKLFVDTPPGTREPGNRRVVIMPN
jgi:outer membrane protein OmpA-like peptidoglycan-associated protein